MIGDHDLSGEGSRLAQDGSGLTGSLSLTGGLRGDDGRGSLSLTGGLRGDGGSGGGGSGSVSGEGSSLSGQ